MKLPPETPRLLVFLAEDDGELRSAIAELLERDGHEVIEARHGIDLLLDLSSIPGGATAAVIVTDERMPMVGGMAVVRTLVREKRCPPFILMSAFATPELRHVAEAFGAVAVLDKPFDIDELRGLVRRLASAGDEATPERRRE